MSQGIPIHPVNGGINTNMVIDDKIMTIDSGWLNAIMSDKIDGHTYKKIRGHCHSVGTADQELSALGTAGFGNWPSAGGVVSLVSTDAADDGDPGGDGAWTVIVRGLAKTTWNLQEEIVTMNGLGAVTTTNEFIRINEIELVTAGILLTNKGDIIASIGGTDIIKIYANHSTSDAGRYTVPAGHSAHFQNPNGSVIGNKEMTYHIFCRDNTIANSPFLLRDSWHSKDGGFRPNGLLDMFTEKVDIVIVVHAELAGAKSSASFEGWIEEN